jgi:uncharacterized protein YkwD
MVEQPSHSPHHTLTPRCRLALGRLVTLLATVVLTLIALTSVATARSQACKYAHTTIRSADRAKLRHAVVFLINQQRSERHLPRLAGNGRLNRSAQGWTNQMVSHRDFTHGSDFAGRITAVGFDWSNVGENIAAGFRTPSSVVNAWMASTGHCQNILSPVYRDVGTGVSDGSSISGATGTWTQDFGLLMGQHPDSGNYGPAEGCPYK